jgi:hypothetical protein
LVIKVNFLKFFVWYCRVVINFFDFSFSRIVKYAIVKYRLLCLKEILSFKTQIKEILFGFEKNK